MAQIMINPEKSNNNISALLTNLNFILILKKWDPCLMWDGIPHGYDILSL